MKAGSVGRVIANLFKAMAIFAAVLLILFVTTLLALDYNQVMRNRIGDGRFASMAEMKEMLDSCDVKEAAVRSPALILPFQGLACTATKHLTT